MTRVLLTAMGDWKSHKNHTPDIAEAVLRAGVSGTELDTATFPVVWSEIPTRLDFLVEKIRPDIILSLGLAPGFKELKVEPYALNKASGADALNQGPPTTLPFFTLPPHACIDLTYHPERIAERIGEAGIPVEASHTPGNIYICNYAALQAHLHVTQGEVQQSGFIHLPEPSMISAEQQIEAVRIAIASCLEGPRQTGEPYLLVRHVPIHGNWIALTYTECQEGDKKEGIAVLKIRKGNLERILDPPERYAFSELGRSEQDVLDLFRAVQGNLVLSVLPTSDFYGVPFQPQGTEERFMHYGPLNSHHQRIIKEAGYQLKWFDKEKNDVDHSAHLNFN